MSSSWGAPMLLQAEITVLPLKWWPLPLKREFRCWYKFLSSCVQFVFLLGNECGHRQCGFGCVIICLVSHSMQHMMTVFVLTPQIVIPWTDRANKVLQEKGSPRLSKVGIQHNCKPVCTQNPDQKQRKLGTNNGGRRAVTKLINFRKHGPTTEQRERGIKTRSENNLFRYSKWTSLQMPALSTINWARLLQLLEHRPKFLSTQKRLKAKACNGDLEQKNLIRWFM